MKSSVTLLSIDVMPSTVDNPFSLGHFITNPLSFFLVFILRGAVQRPIEKEMARLKSAIKGDVDELARQPHIANSVGLDGTILVCMP